MSIDPCLTVVCQNQGTCVAQAQSYACRCPAGFSGNLCEKKVTNCADSPCLHAGACTNTASGYTCACPAQYQGVNCAEDVDECKVATACAHGTCVNTQGAYLCNCTGTAYEGSRCEQLSATLTGDSTSYDFGIQELSVPSSPFTITLSNDGDVATGPISASTPAELTLSTNCPSVAAHSSCKLTVRFSASAVGARTAKLILTGTAGGKFTFNATADGRARVTVVRAGAGAGRITSSPAGIDCSATGAAGCSQLFGAGGVTLSARTTNGSTSFFSGWSASACSGLVRDCVLATETSLSVTATFSPMTRNLVFVSHDAVTATLGSAAAYDTKCNAIATAAGLNNTAGTGFVAMVSDASSLARARLGTASGWVRLDGLPFAPSQAGLFTSGQVLNPIRYDDSGAVAQDFRVVSGTHANGQLAESCSNWTSSSATTYGVGGSPFGGPGIWIDQAVDCSGPFKVMCFGNTFTTAVSTVTTNGRKIWVTNTPYVIGGTQTPDAKCQAERPAGVTTAIALISKSNKAASAVLDPAAVYVRPDGTRVATGAELATRTKNPDSGIWQSADGTYVAESVWTGSLSVDAPSTGTCADWTNPSQSLGSVAGLTSSVASNFWWNNNSTSTCNETRRLYCIQTAP
jgi:hypothetical protein